MHLDATEKQVLRKAQFNEDNAAWNTETAGGGGGAGLDTQVPEGPHLRSPGSPWLLPGMFSAHRTGQGPSKTSTAHTWSGCLPWLGDRETRRGKCEEEYMLTQPEPGA